MSTEQIITEQHLKNTYGPHAAYVLHDHIRMIPKLRTRGSRQKYRVIVQLPSKEEFRLLREKKFSVTVGELVSSAFAEFEELKEELQSWYDNLPDQFQTSNKGEQLDESINALDVSLPDIPSALLKNLLIHIPLERVASRSDRRGNAVSKLQSVIDHYQGSDEAEIKEFVGVLEDTVNQVEDIIFPTFSS